MQHVFEGSGPPGTTPPALALHYTDTLNGDAYLSVGTSSAADWKLLDVATGAVQSTTGAFLDPNGNVTGSVGDIFKSAESLGGDGTLWFKVSGTATDSGWE